MVCSALCLVKVFMLLITMCVAGWMGARSNLANEAEKDAYEKGYTKVIEFFKQTL